MKFLINWGVLETHLLSHCLNSRYWIWGNCIILLLYCVVPSGHSVLSGVSCFLHILHDPLDLDNEARHWSGLASCIMPQVFKEQLLLTWIEAVFLMSDPYWCWITSLNKILHEFTTRSTSPSSFSVPLAFGMLCVRLCTVH